MKLFNLKGSLESAIAGAKDGRKDDARKLAGGIAAYLDNDEPLPPAAKDYLIGALQAIAEGEPGNNAFHTSGKRGVSDKQQSLITPARMGAVYMQSLLDSGEAKSPHEASTLAETLLTMLCQKMSSSSA